MSIFVREILERGETLFLFLAEGQFLAEHYFGVRADLLSTLFAGIGEAVFVTFNTIRMLIFHDVSRAGEIPVAVRTGEMLLSTSSRGIVVVLLRRMPGADSRRMIQRASIAIVDLERGTPARVDSLLSLDSRSLPRLPSELLNSMRTTRFSHSN